MNLEHEPLPIFLFGGPDYLVTIYGCYTILYSRGIIVELFLGSAKPQPIAEILVFLFQCIPLQ